MAELTETLRNAFLVVDRTLESYAPELSIEEIGSVAYLGQGIARITGLPRVAARELVAFEGGAMGMAFDLQRHMTGIMMLDDVERVQAGTTVRRTHRVVQVPVGRQLLGRVVDALGRPLDEDKGAINADVQWPVERPAPKIIDRAPVSEPLQTGLKVVDALIPIGRGQRELILGDRQTGKSAIAIDTIINQADTDMLCVYCAIGQRDEAVAQVIEDLRQHDALEKSVIVVASGDAPPGLMFLAPYAATTIAEWFMEAGQDVLIVYDDLTQHARAYRELSLLMRRPPGREAYPGDIFYIHSRLLERATHLSDERGSGSLTALPIVETQAQNISAYIPTNLISITDGQIYLSPTLFQKGVLPAVDPTQSVSRVGGKAQLPAYRTMASDLRLTYSQFRELESFSRFGTQLDEETERTLERGRRVRQVLQQPLHEPLPVAEQIAVLLTASEGAFDEIEPEEVAPVAQRLRERFVQSMPDLVKRIEAGKEMDSKERDDLLELALEVVADWQERRTREREGS